MILLQDKTPMTLVTPTSQNMNPLGIQKHEPEDQKSLCNVKEARTCKGIPNSLEFH